jgi:uncharacterized membrane protein
MRDDNVGRTATESNPADQMGRFFYWLVAVIALANYALVLVTLILPPLPPGKAGWPEAMLLFTGCLTTLVALARQLAAQNALLAAVIIGGIGTAAHTLSAATALPFGPIRFTEAAGPKFFELVSWAVPLLWILVVLTSRGVARLILRPWRKLRAYGFWLMGLTVVLSALLAGGLEPFGGAVKRYWLWEPTRLPLTWGGAPLTSFLGWAVTTALIMAFAAPALIDKRARPAKPAADFHPLVSWLLALALCAMVTALHQMWLQFGYCIVLAIVTASFAWRGARW